MQTLKSSLQRTIRLEGLHCPDCAATIEKDVRRLPGVLHAELRFASAQMSVEYAREQVTFEDICRLIGRHDVRACSISRHTEAPEAPASPPLWRARLSAQHKVVETLAAGTLTLLATLPLSLGGRDGDIALYAAAIFLLGRSIARMAWQAIRARAIDMNVLVLVAVVGAVGLRDWFEASTVLLLFSIGNLLQSGAMERTRRSLRALIELGPQMATVLHSGQSISIPVEEVGPGEILQVRPGERIPMDGTLITGSTTVDQAPITGESLPVHKHIGDTVYGGTLNGSGAFNFEVTHRFEDTMLARIVHWVEEAQAQRAPAQEFIDRFARLYTPIVVGLALCAATLPPAFALLSGAHTSIAIVFALWVSRALALLLIACPCALVISTPVAIVTAIGSASRNGILVKGGATLEAVGNARVLLYDKTGTLTMGHCRVESVLPLGDRTGEEVMDIALALESKSEHPLAAAFTHSLPGRAARPLLLTEDFCALPGKGIRATIGGASYLLGSAIWMQEEGVAMHVAQAALANAEATGKTVVALASGQSPLGLIVIGDTVRPDASHTVRAMQSLGITHQVMLTGDTLRAAQTVGEAVGIATVHARLLPDDKLKWVRAFQQHGVVAMIGDGINDAPALAAADIGIVMGAAGSDTAMESGDIALMTDDLTALPYLMRLSRRTRGIVRQNVIFSLLTKGLLLITALVAGVPLWLAVLGDVGVALIVTLNALRLIDGSDARSKQFERGAGRA